MTDALMDRLRAANPVTEDLPVPPPPRLPARRRQRAPALVLAGALALAIAFWPSPSVVAQARDALGGPGEIVHTVVVSRTYRNGALQGEQTLDIDGRRVTLSPRVEQWVAFDPPRARVRMTMTGGDMQFAYAAGTVRVKESWSDRVQTQRNPRAFESMLTEPRPAYAGGDPIAGVRALLADGRLHADGSTDVDGRHVLRLTGDHVEYLVDAESYEPVQVTVRRPGNDTSVTTYATFERLPMDPALLRIP